MEVVVNTLVVVILKFDFDVDMILLQLYLLYWIRILLLGLPWFYVLYLRQKKMRDYFFYFSGF